MAQYIFTMNQLSKRVEGMKHPILDRINLSFLPGAKIGVLGLNGAGKSSLLKVMAGIDKSYEGEARPQAGIKVGYLPQEPQLDPNKDVRGNVEEGISELKELLKRFDDISLQFAEPMDDDTMNALLEKQAELQNAIDAAGAWELDRKLDIAADALRLPPWDADVTTLSGGEKRRVALCRLLLSSPDMLLLDEPTNHLDAQSVAWLEQFLHDFKGTIVAVTHDRYFLDNVAGWILELDRGHGIPYEGNYTAWLEQKSARLATEEKQQSAHQKALKKELEWSRTSAKGRHAKSKARLNQFQELSSKEFQKRNETQEIYIPPGPRLGDMVFEVDKISKHFSEKLLFSNLSFIIPKGAVVGIIGANGIGKTTLFKLLTQQTQPDSGQVRIGDTVVLSHVDQLRDHLCDDHTVWEEIADKQDILRIGQYEIPSRAYVSHFNFKGTDQQKYIRDLSGGERNRVHLAKLLRSGGNVLMLDEPTNDLDVETMRALEEALLVFPGTIMIISHDRWFLDRICTHIIGFEGDSQVAFFQGNYTEYAADLAKRTGDDKPHRVRYKRLDRTT